MNDGKLFVQGILTVHGGLQLLHQLILFLLQLLGLPFFSGAHPLVGIKRDHLIVLPRQSCLSLNELLSLLHDAAPCLAALLHSVLEIDLLLDDLVGQEMPLEEKGLDLILIGTNQRSNGFGDRLFQHWWYIHSAFS